MLRQETADDRDLATLLLGELGAAALVVKLNRLLALLDELLQQAQDVGIGERIPASAARLDVGVLDRRIDEPQGREAQLVLRFHGRLHGVIDLFAQHGVLEVLML